MATLDAFIILLALGYILMICMCNPLGPGPGTCTNGDPSNGEVEYRCCANHFNDNGVCKVCPPGYIGSKGKCDIKCPPGTYDSQCSKACNCKNTLCHHVDGCTCNSSLSLKDCGIDTGNLDISTIMTPVDATKINLTREERFAEELKNIRWIKISIITCIGVLCFTALVVTTSYTWWHWYFLFHRK